MIPSVRNSHELNKAIQKTQSSIDQNKLKDGSGPVDHQKASSLNTTSQKATGHTEAEAERYRFEKHMEFQMTKLKLDHEMKKLTLQYEGEKYALDNKVQMEQAKGKNQMEERIKMKEELDQKVEDQQVEDRSKTDREVDEKLEGIILKQNGMAEEIAKLASLSAETDTKLTKIATKVRNHLG